MKTLQEFALIVKAEFKRDLLFMYRYPLEMLPVSSTSWTRWRCQLKITEQ